MQIRRVIRVIRQHLERVSWPSLIVILISHATITWWMLWFVGEKSLTDPNTFFYYYVVTTSTVGYGDLSPTSSVGQYIVAIFQIPLGLILFGALLGKVGQSTGKYLRKEMTGEKSFKDYDNHILIFGWHTNRTRKIIDHILGDARREERRIVLCVLDDIEHPLFENTQVDFARLQSFTDISELKRVAIEHADRVIVDGRDDDQTFTTALRLSTLIKRDSHISAYFQDETKAELLQQHGRNIECGSSKAAEMLVRSMQDPGSVRVHEELLSTLNGATQFSMELPDELPANITFEKIFIFLKRNYNVIIVGIASDRMGHEMKINPPGNEPVTAGVYIHYISSYRLLSQDVDWQKMDK